MGPRQILPKLLQHANKGLTEVLVVAHLLPLMVQFLYLEGWFVYEQEIEVFIGDLSKCQNMPGVKYTKIYRLSRIDLEDRNKPCVK